MSGHNKWSKIKRQKESSDGQKAKIFTKIGREIAVAVKQGGADPSINPKLRDLIYKARAANIPSDNVMRSIKKASGESSTINYETIVYEGYGIGGAAVIVETLTDNKNRTAGEVRHIFDKYGGGLGANGCVSYMFDTKGVIVIDKTAVGISEDDIMMQCVECGADDFVSSDDAYIVYTKASELSTVRDAIEKLNIAMVSASVDRVPNNNASLDDAQLERFELMLEKFDENDDVQNIYHNVD